MIRVRLFDVVIRRLDQAPPSGASHHRHEL
jgi:hypothetical protein